MRKILTLFLILFANSAFAVAQDVRPGYETITGCPGSVTPCFIPYGPTIPTSSSPITATGTTSAFTLGTTSTTVIAANTVTLGYSICNESSSATIACSVGGTAAINTAGSYTFGIGQCITNSPFVIDTGAINCISSASSTPLTVQVK